MFESMKNLTPRSVGALAVVATTAFLSMRVCAIDFGHAHAAGMTVSLVETLGAGIWVLLLLPMTWGAIVYFHERTPDLLLRLVGTLVLAAATSTLVGLFTLPAGGLWAGSLGHGIAKALVGGGGGLRTAFAWLIDVSLLATSFIFATDWAFHSLRRAGHATQESAQPIAVEPQAELREATAAPEPREFVVETPRAAVAAAAMAEVSLPSSNEVATPEGWGESEDDGRKVIVAPSGYRGVEFLPPSDELAVPELLQTPRFELREEPEEEEAAASVESGFEDQHFVTTSDAAYFVESPSAASTDDEPSVDEAPEAEEDESVAEAVQTLFEAVTTAAEPKGGIGLPDDSPFLDEFFAPDAGWPYAPGQSAPGEGASAAAERPARCVETPRAAAPAVEPAAQETEPAFEDEMVSFDDVLVSRLPADAFDDFAPLSEQVVPDAVPETMPEAPVAAAPALVEATPAADETPIEETPAVAEFVEAPVEPAVVVAAPAAEVVATSAEPAPQLSLFAEPAMATATMEPAPSAADATPAIDLSRLHAMELDPLFHDAVGAVLERERASAVVLQRQLGIGYARGIRILDQMTNAGLVGPDTPTGARQIRVTKDAWAAFAKT